MRGFGTIAGSEKVRASRTFRNIWVPLNDYQDTGKYQTMLSICQSGHGILHDKLDKIMSSGDWPTYKMPTTKVKMAWEWKDAKSFSCLPKQSWDVRETCSAVTEMYLKHFSKINMAWWRYSRRLDLLPVLNFSLRFDGVLCDPKSQEWPSFQGAGFKLEKDFAHLQMMLLN